MTGIRDAVLRVLAGQSPGYFAYPNAAAFAADDLDPAAVADELASLAADGLAERETLTVIILSSREVYLEMSDDEQQAALDEGALPDPVTDTIPGGYRITDAGRALAPPLE